MADVNFYRNAVNILRKNGHEIVISVMGRGNLPKFAKSELGKATVIGKHHKGNFFGKLYFNIKRVILLRRFINKTRPDIVTSFSYYPAAASFGKKISSVIFHDDAEYKMQFSLCRIFAKNFVIPSFIHIKGKNVKKYHSYKEWAYLNPKYFKPNKSALKKFNLVKNKYIFIRDVASVSLNYKKRNYIGYSKIIPILSKKGLKAVVSLEDKSRKNEFRNCIILKEPVKDFYSLLYHSLASISSGDTMAREAALLGIPAYYIGKRVMEVNKELIDKGLIKSIDTEESLIKELKILSKATKENSIKRIKAYSKKLDDTTDVIVREIQR